MSIHPVKFRFPILVVLLFLTTLLPAQIRITSPYSRFGIGDLSGNNNAWNSSMAQLGIGLRSPYHINFNNPASYTAFDSLSFLFEGGFNGEIVTLSSDYQKTTRNYASLGYLLFGMPVNRWWKTSLGLVPFSDVGYNVINYEEYPTSGAVLRQYGGSGGISRLYWGNAFQPFRNFSVGLNASYLFGSMVREAMVIFPDSINALNFKDLAYISMGDIHVEMGIQYRVKMKDDLNLILGGIFSPELSMAAKTDFLSYTFLLTSTGVESPRDTLAQAKGYKGRIVIPMMLGGGFSFQKPDKWMAGIDYKWQNWNKFTAFGLSDSLENSWQVSAGAEIIPKADDFNNYFARVHYRLGFTYNKTYLHLRGQDLGEFAVTAGFGFPLRGMKTMVNIGAMYGMRGTTANKLIRESYFKMVVGFSIHERWFVKRKYY